ncbi:helix-turn-helix transcriptional regulator [Caballeronia zhejiangensis]|uniref:Helix-turn-helix domain-containing protein n=1 Tax=Caballeronia zhejiangensis TaxID=871203 RepID=A0A656QAU1_9BURK|nr:helix-turn-helix domain-containing protein [Caballeronia zhejiangensis]KDR25930.1 hypothetical protein BG60_26180 [Caballeronia zhejiangensis]
MNDERRLTEEQLAKRWHVSTRTLQIWRRERKGPAFIVIGKRTVLYREEDVRKYENDHLVKTTNNPPASE